ncbi:MAG: aminodeoxychorismate/anthranilate synthase component II [Eubacterium sp.]|nr:aminodeoxychorismate/anthranilate synthase component II [Eubacterium sp.]MCD7855879.1 aminodeoxychorismate/anthranilate synthase component II [Clostridiales bacterium]MCD8239063.1 aminodeoxychorismate/anthranilate synthase component II [Clostridiales bacterium]
MVVLIDNYDSFTYNLYQYIGQFDRDIRVFRNDSISGGEVLKMQPDRLVISPGPKTPLEAGNCIEIIRTCAGKIPMLGVCLGHQSIAAAFGGTVSNAKELFHGKASMIEHDGKGIFSGIKSPMKAARYHSLSVTKVPECFDVAAQFEGEVMAIRHKELPIIGLQFHPESIYTPEGMRIVKNFIKEGLI